jgi:hypothetical protein
MTGIGKNNLRQGIQMIRTTVILLVSMFIITNQVWAVGQVQTSAAVVDDTYKSLSQNWPEVSETEQSDSPSDEVQSRKIIINDSEITESTGMISISKYPDGIPTVHLVSKINVQSEGFWDRNKAKYVVVQQSLFKRKSVWIIAGATVVAGGLTYFLMQSSSGEPAIPKPPLRPVFD